MHTMGGNLWLPVWTCPCGPRANNSPQDCFLNALFESVKSVSDNENTAHAYHGRQPLAPRVGLEPTTLRLTAACSTS